MILQQGGGDPGSSEMCTRPGEFESYGSGCWGSAKRNRGLGLNCHGDSTRRWLGVAHTVKGRGDGLRSLCSEWEKEGRPGECGFLGCMNRKMGMWVELAL